MLSAVKTNSIQFVIRKKKNIDQQNMEENLTTNTFYHSKGAFTTGKVQKVCVNPPSIQRLLKVTEVFVWDLGNLSPDRYI